MEGHATDVRRKPVHALHRAAVAGASGRARAAGFDAVEIWWPFADAVPETREIEAFEGAVADAQVRLVGLNLYAGDMPAGTGTGELARPRDGVPDERRDHRAIAARLGCRTLNALHGNFETTAQTISNYRFAADVAAEAGAQLVIEPLSGAPKYPIRTAHQAFELIDEIDRGNVKLLADLYHLATNGDDLDTLADHVDRIGHVQIADAPGRGEPGTGELDLFGHLAKLRANGYTGFVGAEYKPVTHSFAWRDQA